MIYLMSTWWFLPALLWYIMFGAFWGMYAGIRQTQEFGFRPVRNTVVFLVNMAFWPVCMIVAKVRGVL
jgi:hypothetical protein